MILARLLGFLCLLGGSLHPAHGVADNVGVAVVRGSFSSLLIQASLTRREYDRFDLNFTVVYHSSSYMMADDHQAGAPLGVGGMLAGIRAQMSGALIIALTDDEAAATALMVRGSQYGAFINEPARLGRERGWGV